MGNQKEILNIFIWVDIVISSFTLILGFFVGITAINLLCLIPIITNFYCLKILKEGDLERATQITIASVVGSIYLIDTGITTYTGTNLYYIPVLVSIYLFDALGTKSIRKNGIVLIIISFLLVNIGWSPKLLFNDLLRTTNINHIIYYNTIVSFLCCLLILHLFSNLRKKSEKELSMQGLFLSKLIAHLPLGVYVKGVKSNLSYTLWNKELENLFELKEEDVLGKSDHEIFKDSGEIGQYMASDAMVVNDKEPILIEKLGIEKDDKKIFVRSFKIPLLDDKGNVESILGLLENITDVVSSREELENAEKRWNYALSGSRDAVWDVNLITDETYFSPIFNELLEYKACEKIVEKWENLVHPDDLVRTWNLFVDHLEGKTHFFECEYRLRKKDGSFLWVLDRGKIAEFDAHGNPTRCIGTISNITYRKKLEEQYKISLSKAEAASNAKSLFLSTMSHEIRTPMNGVIGIINLLLSNNPNKEQLENLNALKYTADNLMFLLRDILDFSKIDAGKLDIEINNFNLLETLQNNLKSFVNITKEKGLNIELKVSDNIPESILGDSLRLNQIFNNLLSNATKFTHQGNILVQAETIELTGDMIWVKFSVKDTGIGIDAAFLPSLFDQFTQASNDTTRKYGGTGLGLAICHSLVRIMGGELKVESKKDLGSLFYFTLPFKLDHKIDEQKRKELAPTFISFKGMSVLLVEDNLMNVFVAKQFLKKWDMEITTAENGKLALDLTKTNSYDLILMDLQMPEMDGFESALLMREAGITTPIFALSANVNIDAKEKAKLSGMNGYLSKPFDPNELYKKISEFYQPITSKTKGAAPQIPLF
jgi:PAS domain S-box-containing protein